MQKRPIERVVRCRVLQCVVLCHPLPTAAKESLNIPQKKKDLFLWKEFFCRRSSFVERALLWNEFCSRYILGTLVYKHSKQKKMYTAHERMCAAETLGILATTSGGEVGGWGRVPFSRNSMSPTPRRKWYLTTGRRAH